METRVYYIHIRIIGNPDPGHPEPGKSHVVRFVGSCFFSGRGTITASIGGKIERIMTIHWKPVSKPALIGGGLAAIAFMFYAAFKSNGFLLLDYVNLPIHEAGHLVFSPFGPTLGIWGGTLLQLIFPVVFFVYFTLRAETAGAAFSAFWVGESLLYSSVYIGDARAMVLPLVGGGEHDWNLILSGLGALSSDRDIADVVRFLGWTAMVVATFWFVKRGWESRAEISAGDSDPS